MTSTYHVAIVSTQTTWRGGEEQARQLARGLRQRGHACTILAREEGEFAARMNQEGFAVETFAGRGTRPGNMRQLRQYLRRLRPDVIHTNDSQALTAAGIAAMGLRVPLRIASRRVDFPIRSPWKYRLLCDQVVCVSHAVARVCRQGRLPAAMLRVVHSGVDPARMACGDRDRGRQSLRLADDQKLLLCVGALTEHKGHTVLLRALPELLAEHPELVVAIAGEGELAEALKRQADVLGVNERVRFLGYRTDVADLMHACDLFAMPSLEEGLGTAVIDAMFARCPIVATTAGGIPELLPSSAMGWTVPPGDAAALTCALHDALLSPREAEQRAVRAEQRARQFFTSEAMIEGLLGIYEQALGQRRSRRAA